MTTKYTKGPWKFERNETEIEYARLFTKKELLPHEGFTRDNDGGWIIHGIAKVFYKGTGRKGYGKSDPEGQANAKLIACAPDLLNACELALKALEQVFEPGDDDTEIQTLKNAISKATEE